MNRYSFVFPITAALTVAAPIFITTPAHAQTEDELSNQAMAALKAERWEELERLTTKLIGIDPRRFLYFADRAVARIKRGLYSEAIPDINRAEALGLLTAGTAHNLSIIMTNRCVCYIMQGDPVRAVIESTMICKIDDTYAYAWSVRADAFYALGDYDKAVYYLSEAQKRDKSIKRTFSRAQAAQNARKHTSIDVNADTSVDEAVGAKALKEKRYADAIAPYTRVIEKSPTAVGGWLNRGDAHYYLKNYNKAIADWTTAFCMFHTTEASPETLSAVLVNRANAYRFSQPALLEEAQLDCELALKFQPGDKDAQTVLAKIKETREESDPDALLDRAKTVLLASPKSLLELAQAIKDLDKVIELEPENDDAWYWRGKAEEKDPLGLRIGSNEKALPFYDKAIALNPSEPYYIYARAQVRLHLIRATASERAQDKVLAASDLDKAIALAAADPSDFFVPYAEACFERGKLRLGTPEAIADFTKAIDANGGGYEYRQYRAQAYEAQKDWQKAIDDWTLILTSAIKLDGENVDHWLGRAKALRLAGKKLLALADYQKAYALDKTVPKIAPNLSNAATVDKTRFDSDRAFRNSESATKPEKRKRVSRLCNAAVTIAW